MRGKRYDETDEEYLNDVLWYKGWWIAPTLFWSAMLVLAMLSVYFDK